MSPSNTNEHLPPWLRNASLPPAPPAAKPEPAPPAAAQPEATPSSDVDLPSWLQAEPPATTPPPQPDDDTLPGWLRDLQGDTPPEPEADADARLAWAPEAPSMPAPSGTPSADADDLPDWLRDESPKPARPAAPRSEDVPAWLNDVSMDEVRRVMESETPAPAVGPSSHEKEATPPGGSLLDDDSAPSWLRDLGQAPPPAEAPPPAPPAVEEQETLPAWLLGGAAAADTASAASTAAAPPEDDLPPWLRGESPGSPAAPAPRTGATPEPPAPPAPNEPATGDLPPWLLDTSAPPAQPPPVAAPAGDDIPAWLRSAEDAPIESTPAAQDIPAWLQDTSSTTTAGGATAEDMPAWLREAPASPPAEPAPVAPPLAGQDLPAWLREAPASPPAEPAPVAPPLAGQDLPAWLRGTPTDQPGQPAQEAQPPAGGDLPAWLHTGADDTAAPEAASGATGAAGALPASADAQDLPPWLRDEQDQPTAGEPGDAGLPTWLRGADAEPAPSHPDEAALPIEGAALAASAALGAAAMAAPARKDTPEGESGFLGGFDLPAWLRVPEPEAGPDLSPSDARSLDWLTRLGPVDDDGTALPTTSAVARLPPPPVPRRTGAQNESMALLAGLAAEPYPDAAPMPAPVRTPAWRRVGVERLLYFLLLLVLLTALAIPGLVQPLQAPPSVPGAAILHERVNALTPNDVVLVAYEWDARRISELRELERAVVGHMIGRDAKFISVSTDPQGALLSYALRDDLVAANYQPGGVDYILLGYKPGGELALRQIAQNLPGALSFDFNGNDANVSVLANGTNTGRPLTSITNLSMIVVMADDPSDVQGWMEQIHRVAPQVPIAFLLPAEANPLIQPYTQLANVYYLAGKQGALAYRGLRTAEPAETASIAREAGAQRAGVLSFVVLFLVGALVMGLAAAARPKRVG